nr:FAD-binding protein [Candidatus Eremiobacteraeota bacterium]
MALSPFAARLHDALGPDVVRSAPEDLAVYAFDAYSEDKLPSAAIVPRDAREIAIAVRIARECEEPIVPRGAGTGLCGGAVPSRGGLVVSFARMNRLVELDVRNRRARVQPGLINLDLSTAIAAHGIFYAPDPSSQKISTIGGNVGTNAGGAHCLSYGTTTNHVLAVEYVDAEGAVHRTSIDDAGYDLTGVLVGSEGTLGIVTEVEVRLLKLPEAVRVCVAAFADVESASEAVSAIIAAGLTPTALEIMDALITRAVEA